jgi:hypothetical protein
MMENETGVAQGTPAAAEKTGRPWYHKILGLCFVVFCFEVGVFLTVYPWMEFWDTNSLSTYNSWLNDIWGNPFFRGAVSGVGIVNVYISFLEILRLIRPERSAE